MSRNLILATGVLLWAVVAIDAISHMTSGDFLVPAVMAILAFAWTAIRWDRRPQRQAIKVSP
jgi:hypothetical protein